MVGRIVGKVVGQMVGKVVGQVVGKVVGRVDFGWDEQVGDGAQVPRLCPRWAVNRTKEATGKHGRSNSKHSAHYCMLGDTAFWVILYAGILGNTAYRVILHIR